MPTEFLVVPQWQGSGSSRAMRLIDGARAIMGDLPANVSTLLEVPAEAGESLDTGVRRYSTLTVIRDAMSRKLARTSSPTIVIGGDCACDLASVQRAVSSAQGTLAVVWIDAHADLHTPETSPTGAFSGMVLRSLLGEGPEGLASQGDSILRPDQIVLAGTRAVDDPEQSFIDDNGIRVLDTADLASPDALVEAVRNTGAARVYIHVDIDVLDPADIYGVSHPEPFGLEVENLVAAIRAVRVSLPIMGACIAGFAPESEDAASRDLPVILRILGALTSPLR